MLNLSAVKAKAKIQADVPNGDPVCKEAQVNNNTMKDPARVISLSHIKVKNEVFDAEVCL